MNIFKKLYYNFINRNKPSDDVKCLHLNIYFKLPPDFSGDLNDAIEELLKYRRNKNKNHDSLFISDNKKSLYENWFTMISTTNRKLFGETGLTILNKKTNKFENLNQ